MAYPEPIPLSSRNQLYQEAKFFYDQYEKVKAEYASAMEIIRDMCADGLVDRFVGENGTVYKWTTFGHIFATSFNHEMNELLHVTHGCAKEVCIICQVVGVLDACPWPSAPFTVMDDWNQSRLDILADVRRTDEEE